MQPPAWYGSRPKPKTHAIRPPTNEPMIPRTMVAIQPIPAVLVQRLAASCRPRSSACSRVWAATCISGTSQSRASSIDVAT